MAPHASAKSIAASVARIALGTLATIAVIVILWLDIATGVWENLVILSGLAAGLVSFVFTALVLNRIVVRNAAHRWSSVNRLAFSEFLHAMADDELSEVARGEIVSRTLTLADISDDADPLPALRQLRDQILVERQLLSDVLSRWAQFLSSSGDNEAVLEHLATIAWQFDVVRDATLDAEREWSSAARALLRTEIDATNGHLAALVSELQMRLLR